MRRCSLLLLSCLLVACQAINFRPDPDTPLPPCPLPEQNVDIALVLGGGGSRGLAHVGVIEELERENIPIHLIVASSAGSIVGAFYADQPHAANMKKLLEPVKSSDLLDYSIFNMRYGIVNGEKLRSFLTKNLKSRTFEELQIPLIVMATDLCNGEEILLGSGTLIPAVHASCAVPGIFKPVKLYGRYLVDGAVLAPIPVDTARNYGADIVIAVDINEVLNEKPPRHFWGIAERGLEISYNRLSAFSTQGADIVIKPHLANIGMFNDEKKQEIYEAGKKAAREAIPKIKAMLKSRLHVVEEPVPSRYSEEEG